jgi:hypothetical protein
MSMPEVRYKELMLREPMKVPVKGNMTQLNTAADYGPSSIVRTGETVTVTIGPTVIDVPWSACRFGVVDSEAPQKADATDSETGKFFGVTRRGPGRPRKGEQ